MTNQNRTCFANRNVIVATFGRVVSVEQVELWRITDPVTAALSETKSLRQSQLSPLYVGRAALWRGAASYATAWWHAVKSRIVLLKMCGFLLGIFPFYPSAPLLRLMAHSPQVNQLVFSFLIWDGYLKETSQFEMNRNTTEHSKN